MTSGAMSRAVSRPTDGTPTQQPTLPRAPTPDCARSVLQLNGIALSQADLALTVAEFERALEIARPLLDHVLPDGLDQAGIYRP